jgi:hypothetical protein
MNLSQIDLISAICKSAEKQLGNVPLSTRRMNIIIEAADLIVAGFAEEDKPSRPNSGLGAWLSSDDTGISSRCIARHLSGGRVPHERRAFGNDEHPHDPSDFGRCFRLMESVPEFRPRIGEMASVSPVWKRLVEAWDELESLYLEEMPSGSAPKLYDRIRNLIAPPEGGKSCQE